MSQVTFNQGSIICNVGEFGIFLITNGSVDVDLGGHVSRLEKGDVVGLCGLFGGKCRRVYIAATNVTAIPYDAKNFAELEPYIRGNADVASLFVKSIISQNTAFAKYHEGLTLAASLSYSTVSEIFPDYERLSALYALTPKKLPGAGEISLPDLSHEFEDWRVEYYSEIKELPPDISKHLFYGNIGIPLGIIHRGSKDLSKLCKSAEELQGYIRSNANKFLINQDNYDLFALLTELHLETLSIKGADEAIEPLVHKFSKTLETIRELHNYELFQHRLTAYNSRLTEKRDEISEKPEVVVVETPSGTSRDATTSTVVPTRDLSDSLEQILAYSELPEETCNKFTRLIKEFTVLPDRSATENEPRALRKSIATIFYEIYTAVTVKSLLNPEPPSTIIKMFLNFGYVDAALAGLENASYLYSIADSLKGDPSRGVYTIREWMAAVYRGEKEPNRNEFDLDYGEHLHELKVQGRIGELEEKQRLKDLEGKLRFELENVFPVVNKITFGRISSFCPVFSGHAVLRDLELSKVTPDLIHENFDLIRGTDFAAYYREILFSSEKHNLTNETINIEVLPDVILTPNTGIRGAMWQEIEGRRRNTAARFFMPMFLEGDLQKLILRITAEFRWEMCKRVQGIRWNDVTAPSLTSEYCDYLQFYRNNKEFSVETRDAIKIELEKARKNFKLVFINNYIEWVLFESKGAPRLNKYALNLMLKYCSFPQEVRERLLKFPRYTQLITRRNTKQSQRTKLLERIIQKVERIGKGVPEELTNELEFSQK